jgi:tetratricopeptide (TPR) repeat protein
LYLLDSIGFTKRENYENLPMENTKKGFILCLLLIFNNVILAQQSNVFTLPFPQQYVTLDKIIDTLALQEPKLALKRLNQLELQAEEANNELSLLNYKRSKIRYRYIRTIGFENKPILNQLIRDSEKLLSTIDEVRYPVIVALLHFQIGNSLDYQKYNHKEQFKHYLKAYDMFKNIPLKLFPYRYYSQYAIALAYFQFGEYEKTIALSNEVESLFPEKNFNSILTVNLLGLSYLKLKKYDQAILSFKWILKNNKYALNPNAWKGISLCNLGKVYYSIGNNDKAIPYLTEGVQIVKQEAIYDNLAFASVILAKIYISKKNSFEAKRYLNIVKTTNDKISSTYISYSLNKVFSNYYQQEGNSKLSLFHLQLANTYKDSLDDNKNKNKKFKAEMNFEKEKHILIVNQINNKIKNQRIIEIIMFFFTLLLLTTLYVFYDRSKLKHKIQKKELAEKNTIITSELELAYIKLDKFTQIRIQNDHEKHRNSHNIKNNENIISKLIYESNLNTENDWSEFKRLFEKAHPKYIQNIKIKLPKISAAELRFMTVYKLNLSINEMSLILNISPDAVRKSKKRLSLKIAQNLNQSFDDFNNSIV